MTGRKAKNPLPENIENKELADKFADYFIEKIEKIRNDLEKYDKYVPEMTDAPTLDTFEIVTDEEVDKLLSKCNSKCCELDPIPTKIIKEHKEILIPVLKKIINLSLREGQFIPDWKTSIVRPLLKKIGLALIEKNYRPVANLSFVSKLVERAGGGQFCGHAESNHMFADYQSAYRPDFSTETVLIKLVNDILLNMNEQKVTVMAAIDLSAAFDTVDHEILISVLSEKFKIKGKALEWFKSYLENRNLKTCINGEYSEIKNLHKICIRHVA